MSTPNNLYPDLSNQPLLAQPPPAKANYSQPNPQPNYVAPPPYNYQGYAATNQTFPVYVQSAPQPVQLGLQPQQTLPNQGFQPNGQGLVPNGQGFGPNGQLHCAFCGRWTDSFPKKLAGGVTYIWCLALFLLTGVFCCIPFCVDGCKDTLMVCVNCQREKARIEANCCWWSSINLITIPLAYHSWLLSSYKLPCLTTKSDNDCLHLK